MMRMLLILVMFNLLACKEDTSKLSTSSPNCSTNATDPDGDGWGWENNQACRMQKRPSNENAPDQRMGAKASCSYEAGFCSEKSGSCRIYGPDGSRSTIKKEIWDEMYRLNIKVLGKQEARCRADLAVAMAMQEAHSFRVSSNGDLPYDKAKDYRSDGAQNVSIFNMNIDFIKISCKTNCQAFQNFSNQQEKRYLNKRDKLAESVMRLNEGFDHFGIDGTLHFHRGGRSGWQNPGQDERAFARSQKVVAGHLKDNPADRASDRRIAHSIQNI